MIFKFDAAIIGGDLRQTYLANILEKSGYKIISFGLNKNIGNCNLNYANSSEQAMESSKTIIVPVPFSRDKLYITGLGNDVSEKDYELSIKKFLNHLQPEHYLIGGNIPKDVAEVCKRENIPYLDLMESADIAMLNAIATAEGAIAEAIYKSKINLHQSKGLVLGYGKCGKILASKLNALGVNVTVSARKKSALIEAYTNGFQSIEVNKIDFNISNFEYIFNTIPALILNKELLLSLSSDTTIIDIASSPGGIDFEAANKLNLNVYSCLGIPGKIAPKFSAEILANAIIPILKERSD